MPSKNNTRSVNYNFLHVFLIYMYVLSLLFHAFVYSDELIPDQNSDNKLYKAKISKIQLRESIEVKLKKFRTYKLLQWFLIITIGIISLAVFIFTKDYLYVVIFLFMMGYYILLRPTKQQLRIDFKI